MCAFVDGKQHAETPEERALDRPVRASLEQSNLAALHALVVVNAHAVAGRVGHLRHRAHQTGTDRAQASGELIWHGQYRRA
ncbi:MAG TPA: hypothetical protein VGS80_04125 [Ktedonobacterales bacterium]|nr:hypothetical protein [Ktedonobacterales bacterium]